MEILKTGIVIGLVILFDQVTKLLIRNYMAIGQSIKVVGNFIRFTYVENPGIAFGIHINNTLVFTILSLIASSAIGIYLYLNRSGPGLLKISLAIILGGAFGNLIDRVLSGRVVDFIDIGMGGLRWWIFNIADSAVVIGMILLVINIYRCDKCIEKE